MRARMARVVNAAIARLQVVLVAIQRLADRRRAAVVADIVGLPARERLRNILRLIEVQDSLAVAGVEVVSLREGFSPVSAVTVADLRHPTAVGLVAPVEQRHAAP